MGELNNLKFYEHHCHTEYSNLRLPDSLNKLTDTIDYAIKIGLSGITITDHECLSGHVKAIKYRKELRKQGIDFNISLGNEIYVIEENDYKNTNKFHHFLLIAKNLQGYQQLKELSTRAWSRAYSHNIQLRVPTFYRDLEEIVKPNKGHIIASTACLGSYFATKVSELILYENSNEPLSVDEFFSPISNETMIRLTKREIAQFLKNMVLTFGKDNFFIEIQASESEDQIAYNKRALEIAKYYGLKWVVTNDVHYQSKEDMTIHSTFLKSKDGERETATFYSYTYFKTVNDIFQTLSYLDKEDITKGIENTILIANMIEEYDLKQEVKVPEIVLPEFEIKHYLRKYYDDYEFIKFYATSPFDQDRYFYYQIEEGLINKKQTINTTMLTRINEELDVVKTISDALKQRLSAYFNLIKDIVEVAWDDYFGNSLVGVSRGSVTGFYTCYLMDIHQLDPIKWNLPYWRFLNKSRTDELPDIDLDFQPSRRPAIFEALKQKYGYDNGLNIITFKTESLKSAILTACRGMGIDNAIASDIAASIPVVRGKVLTLKQCLEGDEEEGFEPNTYFINQLKQYDGLLETIKKIEGIVNGFGVHAAGFFIFQNGFLKQNSLMKSPGGQFITCWDLHDSEYTGCLKFDALVTDAQDKLRKTMDLLLKDNRITWQGSLWDTYYKYLHPDNLNYNDLKMWEVMNTGAIPSLFQFDTPVGGETIRKIKPKDLIELSMANSLCRIVNDEALQPTDKYVLFKNNINLWYEEMQKYGLNQEEIEVLEKLLLSNYGISAEQENIMTIVMDKKISNFDLKQANSLRKAIAKKSKEAIDQSKELFFKKGREIGTRQKMLDYVWHFCAEPQLGYSFSKNHTTPYSAIALQEMNLFYFYPSIYWITSCLTIDASASEDNLSNEDMEETNIETIDNNEEDIEDLEEDEILKNLAEKTKKKESNTDYGKIAKAIGNLQSTGITMELPDINKADLEFSPDVDNNAIIFGLKGISGINEQIVQNILALRPFTNLIDFYERVQPTNAQMLSLIKAGSFDELEKTHRTVIMRRYLTILAEQKFPIKDKLNMTDFAKMANAEYIPNEYKRAKQMYFFREWLYNQPEGTDNTNFLIRETDEAGYKFFVKRCIPEYNLRARKTPYIETSEGVIVYKNPFKKMYDDYMKAQVADWLEQENTKIYYNNFLKESHVNELWEKYCLGSISKWEMESLNYYYHEHELAHVNRSKYSIDSFNNLPQEPIILKYNTNKQGREFPEYQMQRIVGTILDKDKIKHTVALLTTEGVTTIKFYDGLFNFYNKTIKQPMEKKGKIVNTTIEKPWLTRGNKLVINGIRRGDSFFPRRNFNGDWLSKHSLALVENIYDNGDLDLKLEREKVE